MYAVAGRTGCGHAPCKASVLPEPSVLILRYSATMARRRKFSVSSHVFKIAKAANRLRKAVDAHSELVERTNNSSRSRAKPVRQIAQEEAAYERKIQDQLNTPVDRHFYIKLVGIKSPNPNGSSREVAIQNLYEGQELELRREPDNKVDPNAILVGANGDNAAGYLPARLAGEVTRSLNKGLLWRCYVRKVLHTSGTDHWGVTVFMVKHKKTLNLDSGSGISGTEFLAKYYPDYDSTTAQGEPQKPARSGYAAAGLFLLLGIAFAIIIHSC
jgi:hypothetical protein